MKHLKKFNEAFGDEGELWEPIIFKEVWKYVGGPQYNRLVEFNEHDVETIKKYKGRFSFEVGDYMRLRRSYPSAALRNEGENKLNYIMMLGDGDMIDLDWFKELTIWMPNNESYIHIGVIKNDDDYYLVEIGPLYYACDTIEGVISLFKEVIKGN